MNILVVGSGGREHALVWKLKQSSKVTNIFIAPGNAGTLELATNLPISKTEEIINWLKENHTDLVIVGPDNYLADGIVDKINNLNIPVFGPTKQASEIEWSKVFAKQFMKEEGIPTAQYEIFSDIDKAREYIKSQFFPLVIKANGLALGKGVIIAKDIEEAEKAIDNILNKKIFGEAGNKIVIEEYLQGKEISIHAFCDGNDFILFPPSKDHKRAFENDEGANTGGMGTIAPVPWVTKEQMKEIEEKVVKPTLDALKKRNRLFKGVLFPGIMITKDGPKVIEFNARFGDPETQSYMSILESDLLDIILSCINGTLKKQQVKWSEKSACCIVCVSRDYPGKYEIGKVINGLDDFESKDVEVFHMGTKLLNNEILTNGGRVLGVTAVGNNIPEALSKSYIAIKSLSFDGMRYRKDIGSNLIQ